MSILDDDDKIIAKSDIKIAVEKENRRMARIRSFFERFLGNNHF